jgi:outer membrane protein assembly factor BamE (lipoprotein component of BamABCDE complex)
MRIILNAAALAIAVVITSCAYSPVSFKPGHLSQVNLGMSKEEVVRVLGKPLVAGTAADGLEVFRYSDRTPGCPTTDYYGIVFKEGQVIDYGPEAGMRLGGQLAVQELFGNSWMQIQHSQP